MLLKILAFFPHPSAYMRGASNEISSHQKCGKSRVFASGCFIQWHLPQERITKWASCQIPKNSGCACAGNTRTFPQPPRFSDPDMHHCTCLKHVPWCMSGSLTSDFLWRRWWWKRSRYSRWMRNPNIDVSGKKAMQWCFVAAPVHQAFPKTKT